MHRQRRFGTHVQCLRKAPGRLQSSTRFLRVAASSFVPVYARWMGRVRVSSGVVVMDIKATNRRVIEAFRGGGSIEGMTRERLVLLTTVGRKTGQRRALSSLR